MEEIQSPVEKFSIVITEDCRLRFLSDKHTTEILKSCNFRFESPVKFRNMEVNRFVPLKIGKLIYALFNTGTNPFNYYPVTKNTILFYPDSFFNMDSKNHEEMLKSVDVINHLLKAEIKTIATIAISCDIPNYILDHPNPDNDIRILVPISLVNLYLKMEEFNIRKMKKNLPSIYMSMVNAYICHDKGICSVKQGKTFRNIYTISFIGNKWFELILNDCVKRYVGDDEIYIYETCSNVLDYGKKDQNYYNFLREQFKMFEKQYSKVDYFYSGKTIIDKDNPTFIQIIDDIFNSRLLCFKLDAHLFKKSYIIYEVILNNIGFQFKLSINCPDILMGKTDSEKQNEIEKLIEEEEKEKKIKIEKNRKKREKAKNKEFLCNQKKIAKNICNQIMQSIKNKYDKLFTKEIAEKIAKEAQEYFSIKMHKKTIAKQIAIEEQNKLAIEEQNKLTIEAQNKLTIEAQNKLAIEAQNKLAIEAQNKLAIEAQKCKLKNLNDQNFCEIGSDEYLRRVKEWNILKMNPYLFCYPIEQTIFKKPVLEKNNDIWLFNLWNYK